MKSGIPFALVSLLFASACAAPRPGSTPGADASPSVVPKEAASRLEPKLSGLGPRRLESLAVAASRCGGPWARDFVDEAAAIRATGRAKRDGDWLTVGVWRRQDDHASTSGAFGPREEHPTFDYMGVYAGPGVDLVHAQYYESDGYVLVDRQSGASVELPAMPLPSRSGRFFAAVSDADADNGYGVRIVERTAEGFGPVIAFDENVVQAPCGPMWIGDEKLSVRTLRGGWKDDVDDLVLAWTPAEAVRWSEAVVVRAGGAWRYFRPR